MTDLDLAPTETDIALANGAPLRLERYDPTGPEPEFLFEVIDGFIVRKTVGAREIRIASTLHQHLSAFVAAARLGLTFQELGYDLPGGGTRRKPDVSFLSESRWPRSRPFPPGDFIPAAPELAVEVVSPSELAYVMFSKVEQYFRAGVLAVWLVIPHTQRVYAFESATSIRVLSPTDDLTGDPVVPGFRLPLAELFPPEHSPT